MQSKLYFQHYSEFNFELSDQNCSWWFISRNFDRLWKREKKKKKKLLLNKFYFNKRKGRLFYFHFYKLEVKTVLGKYDQLQFVTNRLKQNRFRPTKIMTEKYNNNVWLKTHGYSNVRHTSLCALFSLLQPP